MKILICSGAGLSAESGVDTFRDTGGIWDRYDVDIVCNMLTFYDNYEEAHRFSNELRRGLAFVEPNRAHQAIAQLQKDHNVLNYTCNVDDLLERAGCKDVVHLHGLLTDITLNFDKDEEKTINIGYKDVDDILHEDHFPVKPSVIFFNEMAPQYTDFAHQLKMLTKDDVLMVIGSSESVVPFVLLARIEALFQGKILFINPDKNKCNEVSNAGNIQVFQQTACEFFDTIDVNTLL
jgi:NAD-dependent deacetylase